MIKRKLLPAFTWPAILFLFVLLPYAIRWSSPSRSAEWMNILVLAAIYGVAALGLNIIVGYCGLLNLGFGGFMLIGAYTTGILMKEYNWSFWLAAMAGTLHGGFWGIVLGIPTLRLTGDYFAIVTFGLSELVKMIAMNWVVITRGTAGYPNVPRPSIACAPLGIEADAMNWGTFGLIPRPNAAGTVQRLDFALSPNVNAYWFVALALLTLVAFMCARLAQARIGRAWRALREDEVAAEACGINAMWYKTIAFALSAAIGALAGSFLASYRTLVDYRSFDFMTSVFVLCYIVLGGMGTIAGPIAGAFVLVALGEILRENPFELVAGLFSAWPEARNAIRSIPWAPDLRMIFFGLILIVVIRFRPEGLFPSKTRRRELHEHHDAGEEHASLFDLRSQ